MEETIKLLKGTSAIPTQIKFPPNKPKCDFHALDYRALPNHCGKAKRFRTSYYLRLEGPYTSIITKIKQQERRYIQFRTGATKNANKLIKLSIQQAS